VFFLACVLLSRVAQAFSNWGKRLRPEFFVRWLAGRCGALALSLLVWSGTGAYGASWETTLTASSPPTFPNPRPMHTKYGFGWSGFPGATADVRLSKAPGDRLQLDVSVHTIGLVRTLWRFDATHASIVEGATLHPVEVKQVETVRTKKTVTELSFGSAGVTSKVTETPSKSLRSAIELALLTQPASSGTKRAADRRLSSHLSVPCHRDRAWPGTAHRSRGNLQCHQARLAAE
jgi:hypothetical protein